MKRGLLAVICLYFPVLLLFGCSDTSFNSADPNSISASSTIASSSSTKTPDSSPARIEQIKEKAAEYQRAVREQLGANDLALNELYCFAYKGGYLTVSGSGNALLEFSQIDSYYSGVMIPSALGEFNFSSVFFFNSRYPTYRYSETHDFSLPLNQKTTVSLNLKDVSEIVVQYENAKRILALTIRAQNAMQAFSIAPSGTYTALSGGYSLLTSDSAQLKYLCWEQDGWEYFLTLPEGDNPSDWISLEIADEFFIS